MADVIRMPRMSDTMEEGNIIGWLKKVGDPVEPGDVLAEVETDKATMELESYQEGVLLYIGIKEGPVPVNGILAVIGEEGEDYKAALAEAEAVNGTGNAATETAAVPEAEVVTSSHGNHQEMGSGSSDKRLKASPLAKRMATEAGIDISMISGSGDSGRIIKRDIESFLKSQPAVPAPAPAPVVAPPVAPPVTPPQVEEKPTVPAFNFNGSGESFEDIPLSQMRKVIARRLGESKFSAPHFYLTIEINMDAAIAARIEINELSPVRISFNDIIVKACAVALRQHPAVNSSWLGDRIRRNNNINIGVAVAVEEGLLVPVINHADMKSLSQIKVEVKALAEKAKNRRLQPDEMTGNTFTISNLGMFDIDEFTAIINFPDSCILAVGTIAEKPIVKDGELTIGNIMKVTLSCDHRVVDGATGAQFLQTVKDILEAPIRLLV